MAYSDYRCFSFRNFIGWGITTTYSDYKIGKTIFNKKPQKPNGVVCSMNEKLLNNEIRYLMGCCGQDICTDRNKIDVEGIWDKLKLMLNDENERQLVKSD